MLYDAVVSQTMAEKLLEKGILISEEKFRNILKNCKVCVKKIIKLKSAKHILVDCQRILLTNYISN